MGVVPSEGVVTGGAVPGRWSARSLSTLLPTAVAAGALYYAAAKLGHLFEFSGPVAAIVWLPAGIGLSFLALGGLALWPGLLVADLLANDYGALPLGVALTQTAGNMLELLLGAFLIRRLMRAGPPLRDVGGVVRLTGAIALATAVSATVGAASSRAGGVIGTSAVPTVWRTWWLGDATGALVVVPLALAWWPPPQLRPRLPGLPEALLMLGSVAILAEIGASTSSPLAYLAFPPLIWAGIRFGARGATLAVVVASAPIIWNTTHRAGPFSFDSITRSVLNAQLYITVVALSSLCLAALVTEREAIAARLGAARAQAARATEDERRRIERNVHDGAQQRLLALAVRLRLAAASQPPEAARFLTEAGAELLGAVDDLRELATGMPAPALATLGLGESLRGIARRSDVLVLVRELPECRYDEAIEAAVYYVVAEAVANAQKHAEAAAVTVGVAEADEVLTVEVSDDGRGGARIGGGSGLASLQERAEALGGTMRLWSPLGGGTRIEVRLPVPP